MIDPNNPLDESGGALPGSGSSAQENLYPEVPRVPVPRDQGTTGHYPDIPTVAVPRPAQTDTENKPRERKARPSNRTTGVGGVLAALYQSLVADMTDGKGATPFVMARLMNKYLARCAKDDPSFNKTNTRGNLNKELHASTMTFRTLCRALVFWEFRKATFRIEGEREDGSTASASIDVNFSLPDEEDSNENKQ